MICVTPRFFSDDEKPPSTPSSSSINPSSCSEKIRPPPNHAYVIGSLIRDEYANWNLDRIYDAIIERLESLLDEHLLCANSQSSSSTQNSNQLSSFSQQLFSQSSSQYSTSQQQPSSSSQLSSHSSKSSDNNHLHYSIEFFWRILQKVVLCAYIHHLHAFSYSNFVGS